MVNEPVGYKLLNDLAKFGPGMAGKWFLVIGLLMYTFFCLITIKQVGIMAETFESEVNSTVKTCAWIQFFASALMLIVAVVVL